MTSSSIPRENIGAAPQAPGFVTAGGERAAVIEFAARKTRYCVCPITLNEGERVRAQLRRMAGMAPLADIIVADGDSDDGSLDPAFLEDCGVRALLTTRVRGLGVAIRMALEYALAEGYEGVVTVDGNGKDGVEALPKFLACLDEGYDLVQGSRFIEGGNHQNTPLERRLGIRLLVIPLVRLAGGFRYTDPTNGFRAMSRRFLADSRVAPLRPVFAGFNLQIYIIFRAASLGMRIVEVPVSRCYPDGGEVPTKIVGLRPRIRFLWELVRTVAGSYNPPN